MKKRFGKTAHPKFTAVASIFSCLILVAASAYSAQLKEARVTQVVKDVKLLPQQAAPRPAAVSDLVRHGTAVRTGTESRSELTFSDLTITRLGANTVFSFNEGTRTMTLGSGALLFQVPKGSGGVTIKTAAVTAAITGTTGIGEFHPATATNPRPLSKWLCLEGTFHLYLPNGQSVELGPGRMVSTDGKSFSKVLSFDIGQVMKTSLLVIGFDTPLASLDLIALEEQKQLDVVTTVASLNDPTRIIDIIDQGAAAQESPSVSPSPTVTPSPTVSPSPSVSPTPGKFGTPSVIASDPYVVDQNTTIRTDPTITKNGVTDFGKIYRGPEIDGPASAYLFGSTSAFDTASGFDDQIDGSGAVFKFTSLQLIGDPTISTTGGEINLALIGVNGITSGGPGAVLTFAGIRGLLLATQNGSINLGSEISFSGLHDLTFYARGEGSDLTLACSISTLSELHLYSEGATNLSGAMNTNEFTSFSGGDFNLTAGSINADTISIISGGNVSFSLDAPLMFSTTAFLLQADGSIQVSDSLEVTQINNGQTGGLNISLIAGGALNIGGDLRLSTDASDIQAGGNVVVTSGGNMTIGGTFQLEVVANSGSTTGTGGNITVSSGGSLTAANLDFDLFFDPSAQVTNGQNLTLEVANDLITTSGGVSLRLSTPVGPDRPPLISGGNISMTIGGDLMTAAGGDLSLLMVNSGITEVTNGGNISASISGSVATDAISATVTNFGDSIIGTGGNINFSVGGNLTGSSLSFLIDNSFNGQITTGGNLTFSVGGNANAGAVSLLVDNSNGGHIGTGGNILVTTGGGLTAASVNALIDNSNGGTIGGDAIVNVNAGGDINSQGNASFNISNSDFSSGSGAGAIVGDAIVNVSATSITAGAFLSASIVNLGSSISGNGAIDVLAPSGIISGGDASFTIFNADNGDGGPAGMIGGDATINVNAGDISIAGSLENAIYNTFVKSSTAGTIGGNAILTFDAGGIAVQDGASFKIDSNNGGEIGGNAIINLSATSLSVDGALGLLVHIINFNSGTIDGNALIDVGIAGDISTQNQATFQILNNNAGSGFVGATIGGNATINVNTANITAGSLLAQIDNTGGTIGANTEGGARINMNVSNSATVTNDATVAIYGSDGAVGGAGININGGNYNVGGTFLSYIDGDGAITFNNASAHADVLKAGVFGSNGTLTIGGGTLSADTTLRLYAPGSNGQLNFISNVTLGGNGAKILAANSVTIFNNVVVTIGGSNPADVYTGFISEVPNANYTGFGGNGSTTGTFGGAGANNPQPIANAPPFGSTGAPTTASSGGNVTSGRRTGSAINVRSTAELLALLDGATPGRNGRITIPASRIAGNSGNSSRINAAGRLNATGRLNADRGAVDIRTSHSLLARRLVP